MLNNQPKGLTVKPPSGHAILLIVVVGLAAVLAIKPYRKGMTFLAGGAVAAHRPALLSVILTLGGDPNGLVPNRTRNWDTPLIFVPLWAKAPEAADSLQVLIDHGADVNVRNPSGKTPLMEAPLFFGTEEIAVLLRAGADPTLEDRDGNTALYYASDNGDEWPKRVQLLLDAGADPCHRNHKGQFVIEEASGEFPLAKSLLEACRRKEGAR